MSTDKPMFAMDADLTVYWPWVRPCWEEVPGMNAERQPKRLQRKRTKGWRMPEGAVYVGRGSKWGNPVQIGSEFDWYPMGRKLHAIITTLDEVIDYYRLWLDGFQPDERPDGPSHENIRAELAGHDLACWCPLDQPCHADVLLEVANS